MATQAHTAMSETHWQQLYAESVTDLGELLSLLGLPQSLGSGTAAATTQFGLRVPRGYVARMEPGNPRDPLLLQVLPRAVEDETPAPGFRADPVGDAAAMTAPGVLRKYQGRALLIATGACAINCRYCFRRHFPYADANAGARDWGRALAELEDSADVTEIILSGGDPLVLGNRRLRALTHGLRRLPRVRRIRIHTRLPVVLPERVDQGLLEWIDALDHQLVVVLHANHPREIDAAVAAACKALSGREVALLNQSVLLRGVNDDVDSLSALSERLFQAGVLPYYLHALDRVAGAEHFLVPDDQARQLAEQLRRRLPGYLVPQLVRETPGEPYKTPLITAAHR